MPIYWGSPRVHEEFNSRSFLNHSDFSTDEALIERIIALDKDDAQYLEFMRQPYFPNNQVSEAFDKEKVLDVFEQIFSARIQPAGRAAPFFSWATGRWTSWKHGSSRDESSDQLRHAQVLSGATAECRDRTGGRGL